MVFILLLIGFLTISSVSAENLSDLNESYSISDLGTISDVSADDTIDSGESIKSNLEDSNIDSNLESNLDDSNTIDNLKENMEDLNSEGSIDKSKLGSDGKSAELINRINNAQDNEIIYIEPGTYKIHNITLARNITLQGMAYNEVIIDGENISSIFLIHDPNVHVYFNNLTVTNGLTKNFGGGICIETGNAYVNECIFINNTALNDTNGGAISNYGNEAFPSYLFVNNSIFLGNHADHDGGAVTTCYASCDIFNSVFMDNSAHRDGGAVRVSVFGVGNFQDCIFMYNHADEWGGAYYSWAGNSTIDRCIVINNTAGTNGGAIMVSGNVNITNNIIVNNTADETGGSFYIQQPMFNATTVMNVNGNIITNNSAPLGQEVYIKWNSTNLFFPNFNRNYWGDENPRDPSVIDPDNVSGRSRPTTIRAEPNLFETLRFDLLDIYSDILDDYFRGKADAEKNDTNVNLNDSDPGTDNKLDPNDNLNPSDDNGFFKFNNSDDNSRISSNSSSVNNKLPKQSNAGSSHDEKSNSTYVSPSSHVNKMVELIEGDPISLKSFDIRYFAVLAIVLLTFFTGLLRKRDRN